MKLPEVSYIKVLLCGLVMMHLSILVWLIFGEKLQSIQMVASAINFFGAVGVLFVFMTVYEIFLEEGWGFGVLCFLALPFPIIGSVLLFRFLLKELKKENSVA